MEPGKTGIWTKSVAVDAVAEEGAVGAVDVVVVMHLPVMTRPWKAVEVDSEVHPRTMQEYN